MLAGGQLVLSSSDYSRKLVMAWVVQRYATGTGQQGDRCRFCDMLHKAG